MSDQDTATGTPPVAESVKDSLDARLSTPSTPLRNEGLERRDLTPAQAIAKAEETRDQKKARFMQVLSRGLVNDRLRMDWLAKDREGAWVRDNPNDVSRYQALGYRVEKASDYDKAVLSGFHSSADDRIRLGDVIAMSIPLEDKEVIDEIQAELTRGKLAAAKREYKDQSARQTPDVPVFDLNG